MEVKKRLPDRSIRRVFTLLYQRLVIPNPPQIEEDVQEPVFPPQDNQDEDKGRDWLNEKPPEVTPPSQQLRQ